MNDVFDVFDVFDVSKPELLRDKRRIYCEVGRGICRTKSISREFKELEGLEHRMAPCKSLGSGRKMTKYKVTVEMTTVYTRILDFFDDDTEDDVRDLLTYQLGDFPELFEERCIEDNYTEVVEIGLVVENGDRV